MTSRAFDHTGDVFGSLVVTDRGPNVGPHESIATWWTLCTCGTEKLVRAKNLRSGLTKSCGVRSRHVDDPMDYDAYEHYVTEQASEFDLGEFDITSDKPVEPTRLNPDYLSWDGTHVRYTAGQDALGYRYVHDKVSGHLVQTQVISWLRSCGYPPPWMSVTQACGVKDCVRLSHLQLENTGSKTSNVPPRPVTQQDVYAAVSDSLRTVEEP